MFGVCGAMAAPVLVSLDVTAAGVLFAARMMAAVLPLYARLRWRWLVTASSLIGFLEAVGLLDVSATRPGFGAAVVAIAAVAALLAAAMFLVELLPVFLRTPADVARRPDRLRRVHALDGRRVPVRRLAHCGRAFDCRAHADRRGARVGGARLPAHRRPAAACRPGRPAGGVRATAAATATGLLAGGPALVCAWAAEAAALVGVAERIARRSGVRRRRLTAAAGAYLALAAIATAIQVLPTPAHLPHLGAGSWQARWPWPPSLRRASSSASACAGSSGPSATRPGQSRRSRSDICPRGRCTPSGRSPRTPGWPRRSSSTGARR